MQEHQPEAKLAEILSLLFEEYFDALERGIDVDVSSLVAIPIMPPKSKSRSGC